MSIKVLLIGAGPTSALIAHNLSKNLKLTKILDIHIWEKASVIGGRFWTSNFQDSNAIVDLGAQYLTHTKDNLWAEPVFADLLHFGLLQKLDTSEVQGFRQDDTKENYICSQGSCSIVKHLFKNANLLQKIELNKKVSSLKTGSSGKIDVTVKGENGTEVTCVFDIVISTIPVPEFLQLDISESIWQDNLHLKSNLSDVTYTSRFAVGIFFDERIKLKEGEKQINFIRKKDNPICYWALRHDPDPNSSYSSIIVHTNVTFGKETLVENVDKIKTLVEDAIFREIKSIQGLKPIHVICHRWNCSQVDRSYEKSPGFVEISSTPGTALVLTGDGFSYSGIEGCILSAQKTTAYIMEKFEGK